MLKRPNVYTNRRTWRSTDIKLIALRTSVSRILMHHHPTFTGNRKQPFPGSALRRSNTSKPAWNSAATALHLLFHVIESLEMNPRQNYQTLQEVSPKKSGEPYSESANFMKSRMSIAMERATHLLSRESRTSTIRISQNDGDRLFKIV